MAPGESPINKSTQIGGETFDTMPFTRDYGGMERDFITRRGVGKCLFYGQLSVHVIPSDGMSHSLLVCN
jgi:hypothetical protein